MDKKEKYIQENIQEIILNLISKVWSDYCAELKKEPLSIVNFSITDNISEEYKKIRPDHAKKFPEQVENIDNEHNALTIPPKESDGHFSILIDTKYFAESLEKDNNWAGTVAHELTHVYDFIEYANLIDCHDYDVILDLGKHWMFNIWTEFHAKAIGYYYVRKYTFKDIYDTSIIEHIMQSELPMHSQEMFESYHATNNAYTQMYAVAHFLGRLFIWEKLFPKYFTDAMIQELLGTNRWMLETYIFLKNHMKLDEAYRDFEELKDILRQNFQEF